MKKGLIVAAAIMVALVAIGVLTNDTAEPTAATRNHLPVTADAVFVNCASVQAEFTPARQSSPPFLSITFPSTPPPPEVVYSTIRACVEVTLREHRIAEDMLVKPWTWNEQALRVPDGSDTLIASPDGSIKTWNRR